MEHTNAGVSEQQSFPPARLWNTCHCNATSAHYYSSRAADAVHRWAQRRECQGLQRSADTRAVTTAAHLGDGRHLGCDVHYVQRLRILGHGRRLASCKQPKSHQHGCCLAYGRGSSGTDICAAVHIRVTGSRCTEEHALSTVDHVAAVCCAAPPGNLLSSSDHAQSDMHSIRAHVPTQCQPAIPGRAVPERRLLRRRGPPDACPQLSSAELPVLLLLLRLLLLLLLLLRFCR